MCISHALLCEQNTRSAVVQRGKIYKSKMKNNLCARNFSLIYMFFFFFFVIILMDGFFGMLQVAWMLYEKSAILTVHNHVITRNPRITVTHDKHRNTWFLHIKNVHEDDKGKYMCQINTATAKTQYGYLHVVGESKIIFFFFFKLFNALERNRK